ncbi:hypothetical protein ACFLYA_01590 [Candidatus Dependentiae bacterium]
MNLKKYFLITTLITFSGLHCKITDVAIFLDAQHEEKMFTETIPGFLGQQEIEIKYHSYEELLIKQSIEYPKKYAEYGPVLKEVMEAIDQGVKIIIVNETLARCVALLLRYTPGLAEIKKKEYETMKIILEKKLKNLGKKEPEEAKEEIKKTKKSLTIIEKEIERLKKRSVGAQTKIALDFYNNIGKKWSIYKKNQNFAIFIHDPNPNLEKLGLNKKLKKIKTGGKFIATFLFPYEPIFDVKAFFKSVVTLGIKIKDLLGIFQGIIPKIVYISGHGAYAEDVPIGPFKDKKPELSKEARIANLTYKQNSQLIEKLNESGCFFLAFNTCYSGGKGLFFINKKVDAATGKLKKITINFPILVTAFSDNPSIIPDRIEFAKFYKDIHNFFEKRPPLKEIPFWPAEPFETIAKHIAGTALQNTPSIIFPGLMEPIQTVKVDEQVLAITYPFLIKEELKKVKRVTKEGKIKIKKVSIDISGKRAVALYPTILELSLKLKPKKSIPALVSMIPGPANHFINKINAPGIAFDEFIKKMFGALELKSKKLFYINELTCSNYENSGISYPQDQNPSKTLDIRELIVRLSPNTLDIRFNLKAKQKENKIEVPMFNGTYTFATKKLEIAFFKSETFPDKKKESIEARSDTKARLIAQKMQPTDEALEAAGIVEGKEHFLIRIKRAIKERELKIQKMAAQLQKNK